MAIGPKATSAEARLNEAYDMPAPLGLSSGLTRRSTQRPTSRDEARTEGRSQRAASSRALTAWWLARSVRPVVLVAVDVAQTT
jgi:hypothetical protein